MPKEVQVKNYRITLLRKPLTLKVKFNVDVRAITEDDALEKAYARIGSKHRVPRILLKVQKIKVISHLELKDPILKEIAGNDEVVIHK